MPKAKANTTKPNTNATNKAAAEREALKQIIGEILQTGEIEFDLDLSDDPEIKGLKAGLNLLVKRIGTLEGIVGKAPAAQRVDALAAKAPKAK